MPSRILYRIFSSLAFAVILTTCTTETNPHTVNGFDLLFGQPRLQEHLDSRRQVLAALQGRVRQLDGRLRVEMGRLRRVEQDLAAASQTEAVAASRRRQAEETVNRKREEGEHLLGRIQKAQTEISRLDSQVRTAEIDRRAADARAQSLRSEISRYENDIEAYESSNIQTIKLGREALAR